MLAEDVHREQDLVEVAVGDHRVGPVHHGVCTKVRSGRRWRACHLTEPAGNRNHRRNGPSARPLGSEVTSFALGAAASTRGSALEWSISAWFEITYSILRIDQLRNPGQQFVDKRRLDCVNQRGVLVKDEVGVVRGPAVGRVAMEIALVPVDGPDPPDIRGDLDGRQHVALGSGVLRVTRSNLLDTLPDEAFRCFPMAQLSRR